MILNQEKTLFLIIDVQEKLLNAVFNREILKKKSEILVKAATLLDIPLFVTEQYPQGLGKTVLELQEASVYVKTSFSALDDNEFFNELRQSSKTQVVIWGIETHICVHQTVAALIDAGFDVTVVLDACGSRCEVEYLSALDCMKQNGAKIKTTEMILFELLKGAKHPAFKQVQSLIK